MRGRSHKLP
jgi:hypothetical protein